MRLQTLTGKFPTKRPPDPANESPGAVGAAIGAHPSAQSAALAVYDGQSRFGTFPGGCEAARAIGTVKTETSNTARTR